MKGSQGIIKIGLVRDFYNRVEKDRAEYFEGCLLELSRREKECPQTIKDGLRLWNLLVWADYEDLDRLTAYVMFHAGYDIEEILLELLDEQRDLDKEAGEYEEEVRRGYQEMQGWH